MRRMISLQELENHATQRDADDKSRKREQLEQHTLPDAGDFRTDQYEVARHMRGEESEQRNEPDRVDVARYQRENRVFVFIHGRSPAKQKARVSDISRPLWSRRASSAFAPLYSSSARRPRPYASARRAAPWRPVWRARPTPCRAARPVR